MVTYPRGSLKAPCNRDQERHAESDEHHETDLASVFRPEVNHLGSRTHDARPAVPSGSHAPAGAAVQPVCSAQESAIATTRSTTGSFRSVYQSTSGAAAPSARLNAA
jgi:hypothetical protein